MLILDLREGETTFHDKAFFKHQRPVMIYADMCRL